MTINPYTPPTALIDAVAARKALEEEPPFYAVSITKFVVLSLCTLGLYQLVWFDKHWRRIKQREMDNSIWPAPRALFAVFFIYALFKRIRDYDVPAQNYSRLAAGPLAIGWFVTSLVGRGAIGYVWIAILAFVFLIPAQVRANQINAAVSPSHNPNSRFTVWNWLVIIPGAIFSLIFIVGIITRQPGLPGY